MNTKPIEAVKTHPAEKLASTLTALLADMDCIAYHAVDEKYKSIPAICKQAKLFIRRALMEHQSENPELQAYYAQLIKDNPEL